MSAPRCRWLGAFLPWKGCRLPVCSGTGAASRSPLVSPTASALSPRPSTAKLPIPAVALSHPLHRQRTSGLTGAAAMLLGRRLWPLQCFWHFANLREWFPALGRSPPPNCLYVPPPFQKQRHPTHKPELHKLAIRIDRRRLKNPAPKHPSQRPGSCASREYCPNRYR